MQHNQDSDAACASGAPKGRFRCRRPHERAVGRFLPGRGDCHALLCAFPCVPQRCFCGAGQARDRTKLRVGEDVLFVPAEKVQCRDSKSAACLGERPPPALQALSSASFIACSLSTSAAAYSSAPPKRAAPSPTLLAASKSSRNIAPRSFEPVTSCMPPSSIYLVAPDRRPGSTSFRIAREAREVKSFDGRSVRRDPDCSRCLALRDQIRQRCVAGES